VTDKAGRYVPSTGFAALLTAVKLARPRLHCFWHIHGVLGAEIVTWKREMILPEVG
jgi:hypothetical protein